MVIKILLLINVDIVQILYKDSEHADSAVAESDAAANADDGGEACFSWMHSI